jgi:microcystin degradation protein MlrC
MPYRIGVSRISHESNSFSTVPTDVGDFDFFGGVITGPRVLQGSDRPDEVTGFKEVLGAEDVEIVPLLVAAAVPAGCWTEGAVKTIDGTLRDQLRRAGRLDGVCVALHGAMASTRIPDLTGFFLQSIREEVGNIPVVCALDFHAVVTQRMVELATAMVAYRTHPHRDLDRTGARAAKILLDTLNGAVRPVMRCRKIPMLVPPPEDGTHGGALKDLFDAVIALDDTQGVIACSLCPSYAWMDVPEQGWAALAVTDDDPGLADRLAGRLAEQSWQAREDLRPPPMLPPQDAVRKAAASSGALAIITDAADTLGAGAPGDNTVLLQAMLELCHKVDGLMMTHLPDEVAVAALKRSKVGDTVTVEVGGRRDRRFCRPLKITGHVLCLTDGPIHDQSKSGADPTVDAGTVVCLGVDNLRLVLTERLFTTGLGPQPSLYRKVGLEPFDAGIVHVKTGVGFQYTYGEAAQAVVRADCPGAVSYNLGNFDFEHVPRPMFPLED